MVFRTVFSTFVYKRHNKWSDCWKEIQDTFTLGLILHQILKKSGYYEARTVNIVGLVDFLAL